MVEPHDIIRYSRSAALDENYLPQTLEDLDVLFIRASLKDETSARFFRVAPMHINHSAMLATYASNTCTSRNQHCGTSIHKTAEYGD